MRAQQIAALAKCQNVVESFTYSVSDGNGGRRIVTANYMLNGADGAPVAVADFAITGKSQPVTVNLLANGRDVDHNMVLTPVYAGVTPDRGTVSVVNNQVVFNPRTATTSGAGDDVFIFAAGTAEGDHVLGASMIMPGRRMS